MLRLNVEGTIFGGFVAMFVLVKGPWYQLVSPKKHEELLKSTYQDLRERTKKTNDPSTTRKYMYV